MNREPKHETIHPVGVALMLRNPAEQAVFNRLVNRVAQLTEAFNQLTNSLRLFEDSQ